MPQKTLILSDTHLGRPNSVTADALRPVWQGVDELVINGDAAEVQVPWLRGQAVRELDRLEALARADGARLTLISGNHDAYLTDRRCLQLANQQILVMHGDALHPAVAPWTRYAKSLKQRTESELAKKQHTDLAARLDIAQHVGHSEFLRDYVLSKAGEHTVRRLLARPIEIPKVLWYWRQEALMGQRFLEQYASKARYLIVGHSHRAGIWRRGGRVIINTGAFMFPGRPWCALVENGRITVHRIKRTREGYQRQDQPIAAFQTGQAESQPVKLNRQTSSEAA
ncbi:MAG: metallophosphoesterase family protein [Planctomycetota bacterium]